MGCKQKRKGRKLSYCGGITRCHVQGEGRPLLFTGVSVSLLTAHAAIDRTKDSTPTVVAYFIHIKSSLYIF